MLNVHHKLKIKSKKLSPRVPPPQHPIFCYASHWLSTLPSAAAMISSRKASSLKKVGDEMYAPVTGSQPVSPRVPCGWLFTIKIALLTEMSGVGYIHLCKIYNIDWNKVTKILAARTRFSAIKNIHLLYFAFIWRRIELETNFYVAIVFVARVHCPLSLGSCPDSTPSRRCTWDPIILVLNVLPHTN